VLWLYDPGNAPRPTVIEISDATGRVLQESRTPNLTRPVIAANESGLYLAPAVNSFSFPGSGVIYYVGAGMNAAQAVFSSMTFNEVGGFAEWMIGRGTSLWANLCTRSQRGSCTTWRFEGGGLRAVSH
jgi:hypothetical protein